MEHSKLLNIATELGYQLLCSGAEIYRVEESVNRLLTAYGLTPQVFAIPTCLIVSVSAPGGEPVTSMRRIPTHGTDIELLEACNALCRRLCRETPPLEEALQAVSALSTKKRTYSPRVLTVGYTIAAASFAAFFGGGFGDMAAAGLSGLGVALWMLYLSGRLRVTGFFQTLIGALTASLLALLFLHLGLGSNRNAVTIGTLMVLVPGMALTNAMREVVAGDLISGINRTFESMLTAVAVALGAAAALAIGM